MDAIRLLTQDDWLAGTRENCLLDTTTNVSPFGHPAISPVIRITHELRFSGAQALALTPVVTYTGITPGDPTYGVPVIAQTNRDHLTPAWTPLVDLFALTTQAGDTLSWSTDAQRVQVQLLGYTAAGQGTTSGDSLHSAEVRHGAQVQVQIDGTTIEVVDTWQQNPLVTLYLLDGVQHTISFVRSAPYDAGVQAVSVPTVPAGSGPSVLEVLSASPVAGSPVSGQWRVLATGTDALLRVSTFSLYVTPPDGTESLVHSGLLAGVHYDYVPGVDLYVATEPPLHPGDSALFSTDVVQMGVQWIACGWGDDRGPATYTTAILDGGDAQTQWFLAEWVQNTPWGRVLLTTGDVASDGSIRWHPGYRVAPSALDLSQDRALFGPQMGLVGLQDAPRGRYAQVTLGVAPYATEVPYLRDLVLYHWVPENDRVMVSKMGLGERTTLGPVLGATVGTLETFLAQTYYDAGRFGLAGALSTATDEYLLAYGGDLGMPAYLGESPQAYRMRLLAALASAQRGGSMPYIAQQVAQLIFLATQEPTLVNTGPHDEAVCADVSGTRAVHVIRDPSYPTLSYFITLPPLPYPGFPSGSITTDQIKAIITAYVREVLNPVASVIDVNNVSLQISFPWD